MGHLAYVVFGESGYVFSVVVALEPRLLHDLPFIEGDVVPEVMYFELPGCTGQAYLALAPADALPGGASIRQGTVCYRRITGADGPHISQRSRRNRCAE